MRADDQARPDARRPAGECVLDRLLAERLERAVVARDLLRAGLGELRERRGLVDDVGEGCVDRDARHEHVVADRTGEQLCARADHAREVSGRVDDGVPLAPTEPVEPAVSIARDALELGVELGVRAAAVEEGELVAALERGVDHRAPEELRPTEQEELHTSSATPASSRSTSSAVL